MTHYLDPAQPAAIESHLRRLGWLHDGEGLTAVTKAGEGNMNLTLRVRTSRRTFILKQSRPWVEKYPQIPAPEHRAVVEGRFYQLIREQPALAAAMPALLSMDAPTRLLMLEDLGEQARDFSFLYQGGRLTEGELTAILHWLRKLHAAFQGRSADFDTNREMRALNHEYIFVQPLRQATGFSQKYKDIACHLGQKYLGEGSMLLHGDYFPGSWLQTAAGIRVIDPEFAFFGPPEFDAGVLLAHLHMANQPTEAAEAALKIWCDPKLTRQFAGIEIMRRILGVAQLPLTISESEKEALLETSKEFVLA